MELSAEEKKLFGGSRSTGDRPPNIRHGKYLLMIDVWKLHRGYRNVLSDIHNFVVVKSEKITVMEDEKKREDVPNEVGTRCGATFKYDGNGAEMAPINSTRFLLALWGLQDGEIEDDAKTSAWMRATNEDPKKFANDVIDGTTITIPSVNPTRGMLIGAETNAIFTKKSSKWIVGVNFIHIARPGEGDNSYEAAAKRWAEYEAKLKA
jgi:hypothetical protein